MPVTASWTLLPESLTEIADDFGVSDPTPASTGQAAFQTRSFLGEGLVRPFQRNLQNDFASASGAALVRSCVGQALGVRSQSDVATGELPWRPEFGSRLYLLRFRNIDDVFRELARVYVQDALQQWEPRVNVKRVEASTIDGVDTGVEIRVLFDVISANRDANEVLIRNVEASLALGADASQVTVTYTTP